MLPAVSILVPDLVLQFGKFLPLWSWEGKGLGPFGASHEDLWVLRRQCFQLLMASVWVGWAGAKAAGKSSSLLLLHCHPSVSPHTEYGVTMAGGHCGLYLYLPEKGSSVCTSGLLKPCCLSCKFQSTHMFYNASSSSSAVKDHLFSTLHCLGTAEKTLVNPSPYHG